MKIKLLGTKDYEKADETNYGDCIIVDNGEELLVYDCGSEEHAQKVCEYMESEGYDKATFVLSHNDDDHFKGLLYLIEEEKVSEIWTTLLLKHKTELLKAIGDGRKNRDSIANQILELFDNIAKLSGQELRDVYADMPETKEIISGVYFAGPDFDYMINRVAAKALDTRQGDSIDGESITNAMSIQLCVEIGTHKVLLTGDSSFEGIKDNLEECDIIQLPHHGKQKQAEQIFEEKELCTDIIYLVSDNTGNSNGGSDDMMNECGKGQIIWNTKEKGTINVTNENIQRVLRGTVGAWGV